MSRRLNVEIETADRKLEAEIFETSSLSAKKPGLFSLMEAP